MKLKDLPQNQSLYNVRFIYPEDGQVYYWKSQWQKGVWGSKTPEQYGQVFPLFVLDLKETMEWEVLPPEPVPILHEAKT